MHASFRCFASLALAIASLAVGLQTVVAAEPDWVAPMKTVHARFPGPAGGCAHFGDSITDTLAYWAPLQYKRDNASPEMQAAYQLVSGYMKKECWRQWKGARYGNQSGQVASWAEKNVDTWLQTLKPEVAVLMFGTNDLTRAKPDAYDASMRQVVEKCLKNGTIVILSTIPPRHGLDEQVEKFVEIERKIAADYHLPLVDFHAEVVRRRPDDWDGKLAKFDAYKGYDVPTLIARDGVHPSNPGKYNGDYSAEGLSSSGFVLRNYLVLMKYAEVIQQVLKP